MDLTFASEEMKDEIILIGEFEDYFHLRERISAVIKRIGEEFRVHFTHFEGKFFEPVPSEIF